MNSLWELSLHGSLAFLLVWALDRVLAGRMRTVGRRGWWIALPITFLVSIPISILPAVVRQAIDRVGAAWAPILHVADPTKVAAQKVGLSQGDLGLWVWIVGMVIYLLVVILQTRAATLRWSRERLSTDSEILNLLEDCKQEAGVTAPIGVVVSDRVCTPAILGWLRPRILLPKALVSTLSSDQLRNVIFHELAHFYFFDIPFNWLFTLARALHWFNPFAHLAFYAWVDFREAAADETAMTWMKASSGAAYGETLLCALRGADRGTPPFGALAIGESIFHLKRRITMIKQHPNKSSRLILSTTVLLLLTFGFVLRPVQAVEASDPRSAAVAAMQLWLKEIDQKQYAHSWMDASASFKEGLTSDQWTSALDAARTPLGACTDRKLASSFHQTEVPSPTGLQKGDFVVAQFNSSFVGLAYAVETVCFEKSADGTWKASGYYVKPKL